MENSPNSKKRTGKSSESVPIVSAKRKATVRRRRRGRRRRRRMWGHRTHVVARVRACLREVRTKSQRAARDGNGDGDGNVDGKEKEEEKWRREPKRSWAQPVASRSERGWWHSVAVRAAKAAHGTRCSCDSKMNVEVDWLWVTPNEWGVPLRSVQLAVGSQT